MEGRDVPARLYVNPSPGTWATHLLDEPLLACGPNTAEKPTINLAKQTSPQSIKVTK
jgi:hypothetical protein